MITTDSETLPGPDMKNLLRRGTTWYFTKMVDGKREFNGKKTPFSLETTNLRVAQIKRDALLRVATMAEIKRILFTPPEPKAPPAPACGLEAERLGKQMSELSASVQTLIGTLVGRVDALTQAVATLQPGRAIVDPVERHYTVAEVAKLLQVDIGTVRKYLSDGRKTFGRDGIFPVVKLSHKVVRIPPRTLARFLKSRTIGRNSPD